MSATSEHIAAQIIDRLRGQWSAPAGEWGFIQANARAEFRALVEAGDPVALDAHLARMFRTGTCAGLVSYDFRRAPEGLAEQMGEALRLWESYTDADDLTVLRAPDVGSPLLVEVEGVGIMVDTPRHDVYARQIAALVPRDARVVEIGGGYGGAALQLLRHRPDVQIVLVDLPETLCLAWYFLAAAGAGVTWYDGPGTASADVVLVGEPWQMRECPAEIVFSSHALSEMGPNVVGGYMARIADTAPRWFLHDSAHVEVGHDPRLTKDAFPEVSSALLHPGPNYREVFRAPAPWPGTGGRYWQFLYERRAA